MLEEIQNAIVERNNHGDGSVSGDDLKLAVAMAIMAWGQKMPMEKVEIVKDVYRRYGELIEEQMPEWAKENA